MLSAAAHQLARPVEHPVLLREGGGRHHHAADPLVARPVGGSREAVELREQRRLAPLLIVPGVDHRHQVLVGGVSVHEEQLHARRAAVQVLERLGVHPLAVAKLEAALGATEHAHQGGAVGRGAEAHHVTRPAEADSGRVSACFPWQAVYGAPV